jgi:uncharacterized membrane protein
LASFAGIFIWWLLSVVLAVLAWPLTHRLFRFLPDLGLGFARLVGWLFTGTLAWWMGFGINHALVSVLAFVLLGLLSWQLYRGRRQEHLAFVQEHSGLIFVYELAFFTLFFVWCVVRMKHPNIEGQEKFMDFAFFNSCLKSPSLPPADPWLAGPHNYINYYYFGYFLNAAFARLTMVSPDIAYNLAVSNNFALCGVALLSLGYNLTRALWPGIVGMASLLVLGNLHGALQVLGIQWQGAFSWWEPTRLIKDVYIGDHYLNRWWWSAEPGYLASIGAPANAAQDGLISEFPAFSFLHGDLHPHFTNLPLTLLVLGLGLNLVKDPSPAPLRLSGRFDAGAQSLLALVIALGAVFMGNTWDLPAFGLLASLLLLAQQHANGHLTAKTWAPQWLLPSALLLAGLGLAGAPFLLFFSNPAKGFALHGARTGLRDTLVFWGLFLGALAPYAWLSLRSMAQGGDASLKPDAKAAAKARPEPKADAKPLQRVCAGCGAKLRAGKALCGQCGTHWEAPIEAVADAGLLPPPAWAQAWARLSSDPKRAFEHPSVKLGAPLLALGWLACAIAWPTAAVFGALAAVSALLLACRGGSREALFTAALVLVASLLVLGCEFGYLRDVFEGNHALTRMNTVFKFYFQAWVLFAAALPYAIWWTHRRLRQAAFGWGLGYMLLLGALGLAALVYPAKAIGFVWDDFDRWARFEPTLDGAAWMRRDLPADYAAIQRLREVVPGQPVIAEAVGGAYTQFARVSAYTGFKAVVGWGNHESQWRKEWPSQQEHDVDELFNTLDLGRARQILDQYQVEYVVVGQKEREKYGSNSAALDKFAQLGAVAVNEQGTVVYRVNR